MKNNDTFYLFLQELNGDFWTHVSPNVMNQTNFEVTLPKNNRNFSCHKVKDFFITNDAVLCTF